jgi:hypothetical protein
MLVRLCASLPAHSVQGVESSPCRSSSSSDATGRAGSSCASSTVPRTWSTGAHSSLRAACASAALLLFEAESAAAARAQAEADPYLTRGIFERFDLFETRQVLPERTD